MAQAAVCREMLVWCYEHQGNPNVDTFVVLLLVAYAFLLRAPSEAIPITVGQGSGQCALSREGKNLVFVLRRR